MAQVQNQGIGSSLRDAFKPTENWVANGIKWLEDLQEYYRERSTIEKEYATKLQSISKRFQERRTKKTSSLSVGDTPTMTPGSLENASCTTWAQILDDTKQLGDERAALSDELRMQVAEPIKALQFRWEDFRKRCEVLNVKLTEDRDKTYTELKHVQKRYFDQCSNVEKERQKASQDGRSDRNKHTKQMQAHMSDMNNMKNSYIMSINASNTHKDKYYNEEIPSLLNLFQTINEVRVQKLNSLWSKAIQVEQSCLSKQAAHLNRSSEATTKNIPQLDTNMFIQHNLSNWIGPPPFGFEASPIWHDTPDIIIDESAKVYLQNNLAKNRRELKELSTTVINKKREIDGLYRLKDAYISDPAKGNIEDVIANLLSSQTDLAPLDSKRARLDTEVATVTQIAGNIDSGLTEHEFKSASFAIPTNCDFCGSTIWGMSRKGYHCKACSYNCHKNCQMKVPSNCTQEKGNKRTASANGDAGTISRTNTADSVYGVGNKAPVIEDTDSDDGVSITSSAPSSVKKATPARRNMAPPPASFASPTQGTTKVLYAYDATGPEEVSISPGDVVHVLEGDDGQGWIKVKSSLKTGLVPAAYVENPEPQGQSQSASKQPPPAVAPKRSTQRKQKQVRALYPYDASTAEELSIRKGDIINMTLEDQGDGWATGELNGKSGIFPAAYTHPL